MAARAALLALRGCGLVLTELVAPLCVALHRAFGLPMAPSNKYLSLLDQGLNDFVFERDENEEPVLGDNPLMLAPWRDELLDLLESRNPALKSVLLRGLLLNNGGGVVFSTLEQAIDYYNGAKTHTVPTGIGD